MALLVDMWPYLRNQPQKQTNLVDIQFLSNYALFQKLVQKVVKKGTTNMKVYHVIPLKYWLSGNPDNFKTTLYYF